MEVSGDTQDEIVTVEHIKHFLNQKVSTRNILNASAMILVVMVTFIIGFYH